MEQPPCARLTVSLDDEERMRLLAAVDHRAVGAVIWVGDDHRANGSRRLGVERHHQRRHGSARWSVVVHVGDANMHRR